MTSAIDARLDQPEQPRDAFDDAAGELLIALACNLEISEQAVSVLMDEMPSAYMRECLGVALDMHQLREGWQARVVR